MNRLDLGFATQTTAGNLKPYHGQHIPARAYTDGGSCSGVLLSRLSSVGPIPLGIRPNIIARHVEAAVF